MANHLLWKPSYREVFYIPITAGKGYGKCRWTGCKSDEEMYRQGLVFRTASEAIALTKKRLERKKLEKEKRQRIMTNKMSSVAVLLGVELDEVFFVKEYQDYPKYPKTYLKFTESGLMNSVDLISWTKTTSWMWEQLITGALKVNKLPWKPKMDEEFYLPCIHYVESSMATKLRWLGDNAANKFYQLGLVCKTREEAIAMTKKMIAGLEKKNNSSRTGGKKQWITRWQR